MTNTKNLMTRSQAADALNVTPQRISQFIREGRFDSASVGYTRLIDRKSFEKFVEKREKK